MATLRLRADDVWQDPSDGDRSHSREMSSLAPQPAPADDGASGIAPSAPVASSRRKRRVAWALVVGLALAAVVGFGVRRGLARAHRPRFETAVVERGHITGSVTATGTLSAVTTVQVGTQVSGRVSEIFVDFNSPVKKGQPLAALDPELLRAAVEQAQANYAIAKGGLAKAGAESARATRELSRARSLFKQDLLTRQELDTDEAGFGVAGGDFAAARGGLAQAKAALRQAQLNLSYTKILSPIDGVVVSRSVDVGQTVAASLQSPTLFTIAQDPRKMQVDTNVAEADVGKLVPGMTAAFKVDAYPGEKFRGTVRQVRSAALTVQNVVTYDAVVDVDNADLKLRPGMTANVVFVFSEKDNALKVPTAALRFHAQSAVKHVQAPRPLGEGERLVWRLRGGKPEPVPVRTGVVEGPTTEIVDGALAPGDVLVIDVASAKDGKEKSDASKKNKAKVF